MSDTKKIINEAWENKDNVNQNSEQSLSIDFLLEELKSGLILKKRRVRS